MFLDLLTVAARTRSSSVCGLGQNRLLYLDKQDHAAELMA